MTKYVVPTAAGAVAGAFAPNAPSYYNSTHTPPDNPKKRAYEARAEALPPEHPRRQEFFDYAKSLPEANPVREAALKDMTLVNILARSGLGAAEGAIGGFGGGDIINVMGRGGSAIGGLGSYLRSLVGRGDPRKSSATSAEAGAGIPAGAGALSPTPTSGGASSGSTRHPAATGPNEELVRTLAEGQQPGLSSLANSDDLLRALSQPRQPLPEPPRPASLPSGMRYRSDGVVINAHTGHPIKKELLMGREAPVRKRGSKSTEPGKEDVQIDDMRPLRYPEE